MKKAIKCPGCGAKLHTEDTYCEYCGSHLEITGEKALAETKKTTNNAGSKSKAKNYTDKELNEILIKKNGFSYKNYLEEQHYTLAILGIILLTLFVVGFGIIIALIVASVILEDKETKSVVFPAYDKNDYQKAYEMLKLRSENDSRVSILVQMALICHYRLGNPEEAKQIIEKLNKKTSLRDLHVNDIARELKVNYKPNFI